MADDVTLPGTGAVVASDDVAGVQYQKIKLFASSNGDARRLDVDRDAIAGATDPGIMAMGIRKDTAASMAGTDGDYTTSIYDALGRLHVNVGVIVPGTAATNLGKAEDAPHTTGDTVVGIAGVRRDNLELSASTDTVGDYSIPITDEFGRIWTVSGTARHAATNNPFSITAAAQSGSFSTVDAFTGKTSAFVVHFSGTYGISTFEFLVSYDGGTTTQRVVAVKNASRSSGTVATLAANETASYVVFAEGATDFVVNCLTIASGTCVMKIYGVVGASAPAVTMLEDVAEYPTLANVTSSATNVTLLAANARRKGVIIFNDSTEVLYLKFGATASTTSFTYYIVPGAHWEMPKPIYPGIIDGIWASANGFARVTELV